MMATKKPPKGLVLRIAPIFHAVGFSLFLPDALGTVRAIQVATLAVAVAFPTIAGFDFILALVAAALTSALLAVLAAGLCAFLGWNGAEGLSRTCSRSLVACVHKRTAAHVFDEYSFSHSVFLSVTRTYVRRFPCTYGYQPSQLEYLRGAFAGDSATPHGVLL
jgi:hypothetical protein